MRTANQTPDRHSQPAGKLGIRPRLTCAIVAARMAAKASAVLKRGGTSLPGLVSLWIEPRTVEALAVQLPRGSIVVAGTNGKTTTAAWVAAACNASGNPVLHNRAGSNMLRGIATALVRESSVTGRLGQSQRLGGLFEVDEAALPSVMSQIRPNIVLLTNLFRDQLDRYGELATTADRWRIAIQRLPETTTLILNADDPLIASLADAAPGPVAFYGISSWGVQESSQVQMPAHSADSVFCPMCGEPLEFTLIAYAHLGHYVCPACDFKRPDPSFSATVSESAGESSRIAISCSDSPASFEPALPGRYNVYNAIAAVAAAVTAGVPAAVAARVVSEAPGAFGRAETILVDGRIVRLFLIKNPTGADEVFRVVAGGPRTGTLVVLLSDNAADGEDVSWTWDARFDLLMPWSGLVICGGTRAEDMAVRLKYAGHSVPTEVITHDIAAAVRRAIQSAEAGQSVTILATYTAMLAARSELARGGYVEQYWQKRA